ncbi:hypothetical protein BC826DRAFT_1052475, partial [Russula brevipes]
GHEHGHGRASARARAGSPSRGRCGGTRTSSDATITAAATRWIPAPHPFSSRRRARRLTSASGPNQLCVSAERLPRCQHTHLEPDEEWFDADDAISGIAGADSGTLRGSYPTEISGFFNGTCNQLFSSLVLVFCSHHFYDFYDHYRFHDFLFCGSGPVVFCVSHYIISYGVNYSLLYEFAPAPREVFTLIPYSCQQGSLTSTVSHGRSILHTVIGAEFPFAPLISLQ